MTNVYSTFLFLEIHVSQLDQNGLLLFCLLYAPPKYNWHIVESGVKHHNLAFYNMYVHVHTPSPHVQAPTYSFILHGRFVFKFQIRIILAINHLKTLSSETSWAFWTQLCLFIWNKIISEKPDKWSRWMVLLKKEHRGKSTV